MRRKLVSIILSIVVAVTFMPLSADCSFAAEADQSRMLEQKLAVEQSQAVEQHADEGQTDGEESVPEQVPPQFDKSTKVSGIKVKAYTYKSVTLSWNAVDQAKGYQIYRATKKNGKYKKIKTTADLSYKDSGNKTLGKYKYYKIRAYGTVDDKTVYGTYSDKFKAKPNMPAPKVTTTSASGKVKLSWDKIAGATKYKVYRATSKSGTYKRIKTTTAKSYSNSVTSGKRYYYKVKPYRKSKGGVTSSIAEGLATLAAPGGVSVSCEDGVVTVSWKAVGQRAYYQVFRSTDPSSGYTQAGENTTGLSLQDSTDLENGVEYFYKVRAVAYVNGKYQNGKYSTTGGRDRMMSQASSWYGKKESDKSNKVIISTFNKRMGTSFTYTTPWCAIFVSACAINSGNDKVIPLSASCPEMVSKFKSWENWKGSKSYIPEKGDVIFYDWIDNGKRNTVADHVGLIYSVSGRQITAIEGNTKGRKTTDPNSKAKFSSDAVSYRIYNAGNADVLGYGLPDYAKATSVVYTNPPVEDPVEEVVIEEATEAAEVSEDAVGEAPVESAEVEGPVAEPETDMEKVMNVIEFIQDEEPAADSSASEETYDAFLVMNVCEELDINACVLVTEDEDGNQIVWNELELDGQIYTLHPSEEGCNPEVLNPETIN